MNNEMTLERKQLLVNIMAWYWLHANEYDLISLSDYEFVYDIWKHGLSFYGSSVQGRLNKIRNVYSKYTIRLSDEDEKPEE